MSDWTQGPWRFKRWVSASNENHVRLLLVAENEPKEPRGRRHVIDARADCPASIPTVADARLIQAAPEMAELLEWWATLIPQIEKALGPIYGMAYAHGAQYEGPTYVEVLAGTDALLARIRGEAE